VDAVQGAGIQTNPLGGKTHIYNSLTPPDFQDHEHKIILESIFDSNDLIALESGVMQSGEKQEDKDYIDRFVSSLKSGKTIAEAHLSGGSYAILWFYGDPFFHYPTNLSLIEPSQKTGPIKISEEEVEEKNYKCIGCLSNSKCYPSGYKKSGLYCSDNYEFVEQIKSEGVCDNNFECKSNVCVSNQCVSEGLIQKILNWFKNLF